MKVYLASDHAGFILKRTLVKYLKNQDYLTVDLGPISSKPCNYPSYAQAVCVQVLSEVSSFGVLICGTGIGMSMAANSIKGIRAALCTSEFQAKTARQHNNANILCLGERVTGNSIALEITRLFLETSFEGGRHLDRINLFT